MAPTDVPWCCAKLRVAKSFAHKVAKSFAHKEIDLGERIPPRDYDSVHGEASPGGELVVYDEAAVLPYAIVEYGYRKTRSSR